MPLAIGVSNAGANPLGFAAIFGFGHAIGIVFICFLWRRYREHIKNAGLKDFRRQLIEGVDLPNDITDKGRIQGCWNKHPFIFAQFGRFAFLFYAWATGFTDTAIVAMLFETETVFLILLRRFDKEITSIDKEITPENSYRRTNRKNRSPLLGSQTGLLLIFTLFGLGFVHFSEKGVSFKISDFWGIIIVIFAAVLSAINVERSLKFGEVQRIGDSKTKNEKEQEQEADRKLIDIYPSRRDKCPQPRRIQHPAVLRDGEKNFISLIGYLDVTTGHRRPQAASRLRVAPFVFGWRS